MSIVFNIQGVEDTQQYKDVEVPHDQAIKSEYIKQLVVDFGVKEVIIPKKYNIVITNYVDFLNDKFNTINDKQYLKQCFGAAIAPSVYLRFDMYTYFDNNDYFNYLLQQLFDGWCYLSTIVYSDITAELQWTILLHCPHDFLPETECVNNDGFMKQWRKVSNNKIVSVNKNSVNSHNGNNSSNNNSNETYYVNYVLAKKSGKPEEVVNYHTVNGREVGRKIVTSYYDDGNIRYCKKYNNGDAHGIWKTWYESGKLKQYGQFVNGVNQGLWQEWYATGNIKLHDYYQGGKLQGLCDEWHDSRYLQLKKQVRYDNGQSHGMLEEWYISGSLEARRYYDRDRWYGVWKEWYDNEQIMQRDNWDNVWKDNNRQQQQLSESWHANGQLKKHGYRVYFIKCGLWQQWDENGNIINEVYH